MISPIRTASSSKNSVFKIIKKSKISQARLGLIKTPHGNIQTPCFLPDATRGVVKNLSAQELTSLGLEGLVANTLHLFLRPGAGLIRRAGGLHNFINWPGVILTDSGGYQIYSLIHKNPGRGKISDAGAVFKSPLDGSKIELTPEQSIETQFDLGADLMVCLDDCPPNDYDAGQLGAAVRRTIKWAARCKREFDKQVKSRPSSRRPLLLAVIQGGNNLELRRHCAEALNKIGFAGFGFGARHIDRSGGFLEKTLAFTADQIAADKIRFGLGIGLPEDIIKSVKLGWDLFDCVIPTREGRHGKLFFRRTGLNSPKFYTTENLTNAKFSKDSSPINLNSGLAELRGYSKAYLHYLFKINEPLAARLASLNNLEFYIKMINEIRDLVKAGKF